MAGLTSDFDSYILNKRAETPYLVQDSAITFKGGLVQMSSTGVNIVRATAGATGTIVGRTRQATLATDTAQTVSVEEGDIFMNAGAGAVAANIGSAMYALDDNTVGSAASSNAKAGTLLRIENGGCVIRCTLEANS
jgi:hypothetical protein